MNRSIVGSYDWPHTRIRRRGLVGYRNQRLRGLFKGAAFYLIVFFLFGLTYVWTRVRVVEMGYHLRTLESEQEKLREENRSLTVETATLRSPQRLEEVAFRLGLKRPSEKQVYFLQR